MITVILTKPQCLKFDTLFRTYSAGNRLVEVSHAESEIHLVADNGMPIANIFKKGEGFYIASFSSDETKGVISILDKYLMNEALYTFENSIEYAGLCVVAAGYLLANASRKRRIPFAESKRLRKENRIKRKQQDVGPTHYLGDILERRHHSEPTGRTTSPHERCAHFRKLKSGKTIRVRSCIIHPDRFEGSVPKTLTGV